VVELVEDLQDLLLFYMGAMEAQELSLYLLQTASMEMTE
tara:strand:- start:22 stop:138 length:117 start_codon:yes stop_codon:yes gene_type:complete